jgi:hypothetical protein
MGTRNTAHGQKTGGLTPAVRLGQNRRAHSRRSPGQTTGGLMPSVRRSRYIAYYDKMAYVRARLAGPPIQAMSSALLHCLDLCLRCGAERVKKWD